MKRLREFLWEKRNAFVIEGQGRQHGGRRMGACGAIGAAVRAYALGYPLIKEGASWYLRVFVEKEGGVSGDDCVAMSHALDGPLDETDPIEQTII